MTIKPEEYTAAMRQFPSAVHIIATSHDSQRAGFTATAVTSLTADPPHLGVAINRSVSAYPAITAAGRFSVNTLSAHHYDLARRFAGAVKGPERFERGSWTTLSTGSPILEDAVIAFDCTLVNTLELSTHSMLVGEVQDVRKSTDAGPLLFVNGDWASLLHASLEDFDAVMQGMTASMQAVDNALSSPADPLDRLAAFVRDYTKVNIEERDIGHRSLSAELYVSGAHLEELNNARRTFDRKIRNLLKIGKEEGRFDIQDPAVAAFAISGLVGWVHRWYRPGGRLTPDEVAEQLATLVGRMVTAPTRS